MLRGATRGGTRRARDVGTAGAMGAEQSTAAGADGKHVTELKVAMMCNGCTGAVERVLSKHEGVDEYKVDLDTQKVTARGSAQPQAVFDAVAKTGKKTEWWSK